MKHVINQLCCHKISDIPSPSQSSEARTSSKSQDVQMSAGNPVASIVDTPRQSCGIEAKLTPQKLKLKRRLTFVSKSKSVQHAKHMQTLNKLRKQLKI